MSNPSDSDKYLKRYQWLSDLNGISLHKQGELFAVQVENACAAATVYLQGAQITHYQRHDEHPIIWCSPLNRYEQGQAIRGGIPLCWPWFGALDNNPPTISRQIKGHDLPNHGFARNREWSLQNVEQPNPELTRLVFKLTTTQLQEPFWPISTELQLSIEIGERLRIYLDVTNSSRFTYYFSAALHTYFAISDIEKVSVNGLDRLNYIDCVNGGHGRQQGSLSIDGEIDRIYHGTWQPVTLIDKGWNRTLSISSEGSDSAIVWNPWIEKSKRLADFPDEAYRKMLCVETANAEEDCVVLKPKQQHRLGFSLRCRPQS